MSRIIINANKTVTLSNRVKRECNLLWDNTLTQLAITQIELNTNNLQAVKYNNTVFDHHELLFKSHRHNAAELKIKPDDNAPLIQTPTFSDKFLSALGRRDRHDSYFKQYRQKFTNLKQHLKANGSWNKKSKTIYKQQLAKLTIIEQLTQRALLQMAACQMNKTIRDNLQIIEQGNNTHINLAKWPTIDFEHMHEDSQGGFSKKDILDTTKEIHQLQKQRIHLINHHPHIGPEDKMKLILMVKKSHRLTKLWLDSLEAYSSRYSRGWISRIRHFVHGSLGLIGFLGLIGIIVAAVLMTNPGGIVAVGTVVAAAIAFKLIGSITALTGLISFASLLSEVAANKLYYKQNPTKGQVVAIWVSALFVTIGMGVKSIHSGVMWLVQNIVKVVLQVKGVSNSITETKQAVSDLSAKLSTEGQNKYNSHIFILYGLGGAGGAEDNSDDEHQLDPDDDDTPSSTSYDNNPSLTIRISNNK